MKQKLIFVLFIALVACGKEKNDYDASGNFEADEVIVSAEGSGKILQLNLQEGQTLKAGDVVGYIDSTQLSLRKKQLLYSILALMAKQPDAVSQLAIIQKQIETTEFEKNRIENLLKDDAATKKQLDDLNAQVDLLKKQYQSLQSSLAITDRSLKTETLPLKAQMEQVNDQIKKSVIINPINGTVLTKYAQQDEVIGTGKAIYKIANLSTILFRAYITSDQLAMIKLGQKIKVLVDDLNGGTKIYEGTLEWVSDRAEFTPKTIQTKDERANLVYAIKLKVKNDGFLKIGMFAEVAFQ